MEEDLSRALAAATSLAKAAGENVVMRHQSGLDVERKGPVDLVTAVDRENEAIIVEGLQKAFPEDRIIAEEGSGGSLPGSLSEIPSKRRVWLVDPLDGTTNLAHGYPFSSVSIALVDRFGVLVGVVYDPYRDECFAAARGRGATLNGASIAVSTTSRLLDALVCTGFAYTKATDREDNIPEFSRVMKATQGIRRDGSAALDLCYVACGRFDAYWERGLKPWDQAAGALIVAEAGGRVTGIGRARFDPFVPLVVASNGLLHEHLMTLLEPSR